MSSQDNRQDKGQNPLESLKKRYVSVAGVLERILAQFDMEHADDSPAVQEATSDAERRALMRDAAEYVFAVESLHLSLEERAEFIRLACSERFSYGPLDALLEDDRITTIALEGAVKIAVRYGPGKDFTALEPIFEDDYHLQRILKRMLRNAGAELRPDLTVIEAGLLYAGRRICLNLAMPPAAPVLSADLRLHPRKAPDLPNLVEAGMLDEATSRFLEALMRSGLGFVIVGEPESGKTTLMSALLAIQSSGQSLASVEWSPGLALPAHADRFLAHWPISDEPGPDFEQQIRTALLTSPSVLVVDELRSDQPEAIAPLLLATNPPRQIWNIRGSSDPKRLRSALGMLVRLADSNRADEILRAFYERLPFVIVLRRRLGRLYITSIAEWQADLVSGYVEYTELLREQDGQLMMTGRYPRHKLDLPNDYWS